MNSLAVSCRYSFASLKGCDMFRLPSRYQDCVLRILLSAQTPNRLEEISGTNQICL